MPAAAAAGRVRYKHRSPASACMRASVIETCVRSTFGNTSPRSDEFTQSFAEVPLAPASTLTKARFFLLWTLRPRSVAASASRGSRACRRRSHSPARPLHRGRSSWRHCDRPDPARPAPCRAFEFAQKEASQQTPPDDRYRRRAACDPAASGVIAMPRLRSCARRRPRRRLRCDSITTDAGRQGDQGRRRPYAP
jgi:hypothetical protein